ncbi:histidine phosphatase family protein [Bacillus sp. Bva_UNVM-123]|uniref:histidine phosphatase family protein n=1 Tax=Bacillus sp. Bva_UNVM-123 TaxID=2829798 RepID=UPI00391F12D0
MTSICLVRHGETDWNVAKRLQGKTDIPLNKNGIWQSHKCGEYLQASEWDIIVTSPLKRAKQTAELINENIKILLLEMDEFVERGFGDAEGMTKQECIQKFPNKIYPNQEETEDFHRRVMSGIEKINESFKGKKVLLVAHGAVINAILAILSNGEIGSGKTILLNTCISNIHFIQEGWKIKDYNQIAHLLEMERR